MKTGDKILSVMVVVLILASIFLIPKSDGNIENKYVTVQVDSEVIKKIQLKDGMQEIYSFPFRDQKGYIEIKNGAVRMLPMDWEVCPKGICSNTGWIKERYQIIVCLPNRITVTIQEDIEENPNEVDGISL